MLDNNVLLSQHLSSLKQSDVSPTSNLYYSNVFLPTLKAAYKVKCDAYRPVYSLFRVSYS